MSKLSWHLKPESITATPRRETSLTEFLKLQHPPTPPQQQNLGTGRRDMDRHWENEYTQVMQLEKIYFFEIILNFPFAEVFKPQDYLGYAI